MKGHVKHLVVLLGGYHPSYSAPGLVVEKMLPELKKHFRITVVTVRRVAHALGTDFVYRGVRVIEHSYALNDRVVESRCSGQKSFIFWRLLEMFVKRLQSGVDTHSWGTSEALATLERIYRDDPFSALVAVAFPAEALQSGARFKRAHPDVRFVTYSTDTWFRHPVLSAPLNRAFFSGRVVRSERDAYRAADHCFFSQEICRDARDVLLPLAGKASPLNYIVANLPEQAPAAAAGGTVRVVYAGSFSQTFRNPQYFLDVVDQLLKKGDGGVRFDFYLTTQECMEPVRALSRRHPGNVAVLPPVSEEEVKAVMRSAGVLLNFSNDLDSFSPSKVFDYIATGLPLIDVLYRGRQPSDVFKRYPVMLEIVNGGDVAVDAARLADFIRAAPGQRVGRDTLAAIYSEYMLPAVLAAFVEQLGPGHEALQ